MGLAVSPGFLPTCVSVSQPTALPSWSCHTSSRSQREGFAPYPKSRGPCTRRSWRKSSRSGGCARWGASAGVAGVSMGHPSFPPSLLPCSLPPPFPPPHSPVLLHLCASTRVWLSALHPQCLFWGNQIHLLHQPVHRGCWEQHAAPTAPGPAQGTDLG